jgi:hypothetical protein
VSAKGKRYWTCPCGTRNERIKRKCTNTECNRSRPKPRVPKHAVTLRDDTYEAYTAAARAIHGVADESCCVCGKPRIQERRHDRDHGHNRTELAYGRPRGLACVECNRLMPHKLTAERARLIAEYLERVATFYGEQPEDELAA